MMKTTPYYIYNWMALMLMSVSGMVSCVTIDDSSCSGSQDATLTFSVSTNRGATRMVSNVVQQNGNFRGIQDLWLFPFNSVTADLSGQSLGGNVIGSDYDMQHDRNPLNYYNNKSQDIPTSTNRFLCYAKAVREIDNNFYNGSIIPSITTPGVKVNVSDITFSPTTIYTATTEDNKPVVNGQATAIAEYLTRIANAIKALGAEKDELFRKFVNEGHPVACSSTNVQKLAAWVATEGISLTGIDAPSGDTYPANIFLPEGAAVVMWQKPEGESAYRFVPQVQTTTECNINSLDRFVYPAELYYYANSLIKTSATSQLDYYNLAWDEVLKLHETPELNTTIGGATIIGGEASTAIVDPLNYAVGCLQIGLVVSNTLTDANVETPKTINIGSGYFPLTGVFVSGQYTQNYDFTPKDGTDECIIYDIYDNQTGISMGNAATSPSNLVYTNTLVLQSKDGTNVRFALEFTNNKEDFEGANGTVFKDTKFYLVGTIEVTGGHTGSEEYKNRAFTKDYLTVGTVTINSLQQAYTYLPDLLDPRLEIGIKLIPKWIQSTTTNVPL